MDLFSKFAQNYIINNKDKNTLLDKIDFLLKNMEKIYFTEDIDIYRFKEKWRDLKEK